MKNILKSLIILLSFPQIISSTPLKLTVVNNSGYDLSGIQIKYTSSQEYTTSDTGNTKINTLKAGASETVTLNINLNKSIYITNLPFTLTLPTLTLTNNSNNNQKTTNSNNNQKTTAVRLPQHVVRLTQAIKVYEGSRDTLHSNLTGENPTMTITIQGIAQKLLSIPVNISVPVPIPTIRTST